MRPRSERPQRRSSHQQGDAPDIAVEVLKYRPGDLVAEKYRLEELIGQGAMGAIWRARNVALDVDVAVKLIHGDLVSAETIERLEREAHAAARLEHPSAVRVFDLGQSELGDPFIVMELLRGESLNDLLDRREKLAPEEAVALLLPVASALAAAHGKGIVHRDLKPDNIVLVETDAAIVPKIVDFGIAIVESSRFQRRSTLAGDVIGSPDYMSPEQARGADKMDARTDVWSLAVVLYECIAGRTPFDAPQALALIRAIIETEPPSLNALGVADEKLSLIVERALTKDLQKRTPDMRTFGRALAEWALAAGIEADATGASIQAAWLRPQRGSLSSTGNLRPGASVPPAAPGAPRVNTAAAAVWTPVRRTTSARNRSIAVGAAALCVVGVGAAILVVTSRERPTSGNPALPPAAPNEAPATTSAPEAAKPAPSIASASSAVASSRSTSASTSAATSAAQARESPSDADPTSCVVALFSADAFEPNASLAAICTETDPKRGATLIRSEIARHGLIGRKTTDAMRAWATLSWFELPAFIAIRTSCCARKALPALHLPPPVGTCPPLDPIFAALTNAIAEGSDTVPVVDELRDAFGCFERARRLNPTLVSSYGYDAPPAGGAEAVFRGLLDRAKKAPR